MIRTSVAISLVVVALFGGTITPCSAKERPFEQPPVLTEEGAQKPNLTEEAVNRPAPCRPQGSVARDGSIVTVKLDFMRAHFDIDNPDPSNPRGGVDPVELRSYGGCKTGPEIKVKPGDTLRVNLFNQTDANDLTCGPNPRPGVAPAACFNTTNLHVHGLHVSPAGNSDNVLLNIVPQTYFPYEINVPEDHPAGTFWYHTHRHGSTALQVASGTSGALIVEGTRPYRAPTPSNPHPVADIDTILHTPNGASFPDQVFLFQQIAYACFDNDPKADPSTLWQNIYTTTGLYNAGNANNNSGPAVSPWTCPLPEPGKPVSAGAVENFSLQLFSPSIWDTNGRFTSINGVVQPTINVQAGQIQHWRFIHAGIHDTINVQIVRASPAENLIATSALVGNRMQQKPNLLAACNATAQSLIPQFEIAVDGLTRTKIHTIHAQPIAADVLESNYLQPGYRSDILVAFPEDGDFCLLNQAVPREDRISGQGPSSPELLAYIHVRGGKAVTTPLEEYVENALYEANPTLPAPVREGLRTGDLSPWAPFTDLPAPTGSDVQQAHFEIDFPKFLVNGASYDPNVVNITRQVNTVDDWLLTSTGEPHVFHIHVNPFEIMDVTTANPLTNQQESIYDKDGKCKPPKEGGPPGLISQYCGMRNVFRDTVFVQNNYQIHIRTKYERYIGEYVLHCHILDHEDAGMMLNISIVPDINAPNGGIGMGSMHHEAAGGTAMPATSPRSSP